MSKDPQHPPGGAEPPRESDSQKRQAGNGSGNFALVPNPPGALEKAEPGAKRILSGMVADTLALVKTPPATKRVIRVIVGGLESLDELFALFVSVAADGKTSVKVEQYETERGRVTVADPVGGQARVEVEHYERVNELWRAVDISLDSGHKFDLAFLNLDLFSPPTEKDMPSEDASETMRRVCGLDEPGNDWIVNAGLLMVGVLSGFWQIPVVVLTWSGYEGAEVFVKQAGGDALFPVLFEPPVLIECVRGILNRKTHKKKIFLIDDDSERVAITEHLIRGFCKPATVLSFGDPITALEHLSKTCPDLLIVAVPPMESGFDRLVLLNHLAVKKAKCPVLVQYENDEFLKPAKDVASSELNVTYLKMPSSYIEFVAAISRTEFNRNSASEP